MSSANPESPRSIELEVEVVGTPEQVWEAIATARGISSWYVPHTMEEREGGAAVASFGPGPEMQIPGRVAAWQPPHRIVFDGGTTGEGLAFEWLVEAREGGTCIVRLVNSGFGNGDEWDGQYDAMKDGWGLFLRNLQLHLAHFPGQSATATLPMAMWTGTREDVWRHLVEALGLSGDITVGTHITVNAHDAPAWAGTVVDAASWRIAVLLDQPCHGTGFIAVEGLGDQFGVSIWSYLYGDESAEIARHNETQWVDWLANNAPATEAALPPVTAFGTLDSMQVTPPTKQADESQPTQPVHQLEPTYHVVWPQAPLGVQARWPAPRLDTLHGKRIAFAWDYLFRGDQLFPVLADELRRRFEGVEIVNYDVFGNLHGPDEHALVAQLPNVLARYRIDAVVSGNGC